MKLAGMWVGRLMVVLSASIATGCVIVSEPKKPATVPPPPNATPAPAPAAPASNTTPAATSTNAETTSPRITVGGRANTTTRTTAAGPEGPHITVEGTDYVTLSKPVAFGSGSNGRGSFTGFVYFPPPASGARPNLEALTPAGVLFTTGFDVYTNNYAQGFPGIDQGRNENFAIRYQGTFATSLVGDYAFRVVADDFASLTVDNALTASTDAAGTQKEGHARLGAGAHTFRLDYVQGARGPVTLKVTVVPPGGRERPFAVVM